MFSRKIIDSSLKASTRSKADKENVAILYYLKSFRKPYLNVEKLFDFSQVDVINKICKQFNLTNIDFGNWTSQTQRYNFTLALYLALYDLQKILKFKNNNLGFGALSIGYGSRGAKRALAHYEPRFDYINISRERRKDKYPSYDKDALREYMSGFGSLAHEYGHFLDYYFGRKSGGLSMALTGGTVTLPPVPIRFSPLKHDAKFYRQFFYRTIVQNTTNNLRTSMYVIFYKLFVKKDGRPTPYYTRLYTFASQGGGKYWIRLNEVWARLFEVYIVYKLRKINIKNKVLVADGKGKYTAEFNNKRINPVYVTLSELKKVEGDIDDLLLIFNNKI
jgi:hypothetical protein